MTGKLVVVLDFVLSYLDFQALLDLPVICKDARLGAISCEDAHWARLLRSRRSQSWSWDGVAPGDVEEQLWPTLDGSPKEEFRLLQYLVRHQFVNVNDALRSAASNDQRIMLTLLLRAKADPNAMADSGAHGVGFTQVGAYPLHLAAKRSHLKILDMLMLWGADVDVGDQ